MNGESIAVSQLEHLAGDVRPTCGLARAGAVISAVGGRRRGPRVTLAIAEEPEDGAGHVVGEGQAAYLVAHHGHLVQVVAGVRAAVGELHHRLHEVAPVADDPRAAQDVVLRAG